MAQNVTQMGGKLAFTLLALLLFVSAATTVNDTIISYVQPLTLIFIGIILLVEVGLLIGTKMGEITDFGGIEWVTLIVGVLVLAIGIIELPFIPIAVPTLAMFGGIIGMVAAVALVIQAWFPQG
tara:strand:- start:4052 stop:4423 length:372 start_codon:yes stop_codon:yes gene_type:complete